MIETAQYTESGSIKAAIDGAKLLVPNDMSNRHRQMIAEWEAEGNTIAPYVEPPAPTPQRVTRRQGRLALIDAGKLADVEAAIAAIADPIEQMKAQVEYEADTWERGNAFLQAMWAQLGGTEQQLDALFLTASTK